MTPKMTRMFAGAGLFLLPNLLLAQVSVLTANYDNSRTNSNLNETTLNPSNVTTATFGKIGSFPVDGQIYAQPLYATGIQIPGVGTRDVVYTVTMHNSVYAIDAGAPASLLPLWQVNLGPAVPSSVLNFTVGDSVQIYTDILPEVGILGTPVIDPGRQAIYVVSETLENGVPIFRMHALSLADGHEMFYGPVVIAAAVPGIGAGSGNGTLQFDAAMHLQRPGLALANGMVYAAFGSHGDAAPFHGWMIGYDAGDLRRQVAAFNSTPNGWGASFWQAGRAPAIDAAGNIIAVTGNGNVTASDFGNSILKLSGRDLSLLDWFTPNNWSELNANDYDLGSVGAILIPSSNQVLTIGKSGNLLLIRSDFMGHHAPWNSATAQSFTANHATVDGIASMALWHRDADSMVYLLEPFGALKSYRIADGRLDWTVQSQSSPTTYTKSAGVVVSANGDSDGTGIVWQSAADLLGRQVPGILHAFDAADLSKELWNSEMMPERDTLGRFAKFVAPTVVNGRVYMPTFSNRLAIYGLLSTASAQDMNEVQVTAVANSASLLQSAISPGEVVAISGAHLGPQSMSLAQIDDKGRAANTWDGTQVLFDGVAAPLLYTSSGEVGAVAPFGIPGPTTQVQVAYRGRLSRPMTFPVAQAAPALFAQDGTGGGQGAILNADGSMNGPDHPAKPGSIVSLFATGLGQTDPVSEDGVLGDRLALPAAHLPVAVLMDGKPVEIQYQGAAPDMMHGFFQINARIPDTIQVPAAGIVNVVIKVGEFRSPNLITLAVDDVR